MTGATSAVGGNGGGFRTSAGRAGNDGLTNSNYGGLSRLGSSAGGAGGAGQILIEYFE
jgi:hypothetical protein